MKEQVKVSAVYAEKATAMRFNPLKAESPTDNIFEIYPELSELDEIRDYMLEQRSKHDKVLSNQSLFYMLWLYSPDTVLNVKPVEELERRKWKAGNLAEFALGGDGNFNDKVLDRFINLGDQAFVKAVLSYLRFRKHDLFREIIVTEEEHFEALRIRMEPTIDAASATKKETLRKQCKEMVKDIRDYWVQFWEDHDDLKEVGQEMIYETIEDRARINTGV
jgi:hypothetical protein